MVGGESNGQEHHKHDWALVRRTETWCSYRIVLWIIVYEFIRDVIIVEFLAWTGVAYYRLSLIVNATTKPSIRMRNLEDISDGFLSKCLDVDLNSNAAGGQGRFGEAESATNEMAS